jgi:hypothetical protein
MRAGAAFILVVTVLGLLGCSSSGSTTTSGQTQAAKHQRQPPKTGKFEGSFFGGKKGGTHTETSTSFPADWTHEEKQQHEANRLLCASESQRQLANEWNVANNPAAIAHAIGREYRNRQDMEIAAEEGCLAALDLR